MNTITIPATYHADLNLHDTQIAIKTVKDFFLPADTLTEAEPSSSIRSNICSTGIRP